MQHNPSTHSLVWHLRHRIKRWWTNFIVLGWLPEGRITAHPAIEKNITRAIMQHSFSIRTVTIWKRCLMIYLALNINFFPYYLDYIEILTSELDRTLHR